ncbi:hypothetical protein QO010_004363 [Caulobacter ginsengisoli]|uniref:Transcriptional regulator n=1 Tax=Caulobacter ginsengisoli TaxID=400775 RepID=A0ABU0IX37_9CAUL|nr:hypothetical protein [Caulobacter ginsengisoli]MDQ0466568.1 hypothetical protein [Caulobacter ginsengisoli]
MEDARETTDGRSVFHAKLANVERQRLKLLVDVLEAYDPKSEEDFADVIDLVLNNRFTPTELALEFKVSVGTVSRWRSGKSCPPTYARGVIVNRLREMQLQYFAQRKTAPMSTLKTEVA